MASTASERKAKEREEKKAQGMTQKAIWFQPEVIDVIQKYKDEFGATDEKAINELILRNKALN